MEQAIKLNKTELRAKLENLNRQQAQVEADKKCAAKAYGDEIKEIKAEIKEVLEDLKIAE